MPTPDFHVVGADHIDLAWKKASGEMAELQESFVVRLLDLLETNPRFTYVIEQAAHFRRLAAHRPDLLDRIRRYVVEGRLEVVGCMASTMETNMPCGEAFVRNQLLGIRWFQEHFDVKPQVGWLVDTFGVNAQVPQILRQFGVRHLMANRLGGEKFVDVFHAEGLDGSRVLVAGRDVFSPHVKAPRVHFRFTGTWDEIDRLFQDCEGLEGDGPFLVVPYMENEILPSSRIDDALRRLTALRPGARYSLPRDFFRALESTGEVFPVESADLNPEFTGCFSQRIEPRLANRRAEALLLEAEQWRSLSGLGDEAARAEVEGAWWIMAFNHFHDVFTGSHPTFVMNEVLGNFREVERVADGLLRPVFGERAKAVSAAKPLDVTVVNSTPWSRRGLVGIPLEPGWQGTPRVERGGRSVPSTVDGEHLLFVADLPAAGARGYRIVPEAEASNRTVWQRVENATIQNEHVRLELDRDRGIRSLVGKKSGRVVLENAGGLLTLQRDHGNFQYEMPVGSELAAAACTMDLRVSRAPGLCEKAALSGEFPSLDGSPGTPARWTVELTLVDGIPWVDVAVRVDWDAEASRLRLKVPSTIDSAGGIYEVPFGVVNRRPYAPGFNKKGEWPAQRFVAIEDAEHGLALVNTGVPGVEASGGTLWSTILRAPKTEYAGMVPDDTSSQHGHHVFRFALVPYDGSLSQSPVLRAAQELNSPPRVFTGSRLSGDRDSAIELHDPAVVMASVKIPEDGVHTDSILRIYEATGTARRCTIRVAGATEAWLTDLPEQAREPLDCRGGVIEVALKPFEIRTIRVRLSGSRR